ncbi:hypothetical protein CAL22_16285 [Bordetella genomosp. 12]|uniref:Uncharacterized protein n=1 Tax=Bordetella genomosp. 12 TaxID=463035 RepID=A0A261VB57_9BORD|nr:hypothetical protein CAL22_16285 [Bordetella genomosp. 12]
MSGTAEGSSVVPAWAGPACRRGLHAMAQCGEAGLTMTRHKTRSHAAVLASLMVPEAGIEPARLAARDFLTTSAFAASAEAVRGLEHAFTLAWWP